LAALARAGFDVFALIEAPSMAPRGYDGLKTTLGVVISPPARIFLDSHHCLLSDNWESIALRRAITLRCQTQEPQYGSH
jgi:hypothetical protein